MKQQKQKPGWVTGPARKPLLEAGLELAGQEHGHEGVFQLLTAKPWFDGKHYWIPVQIALPPATAARALSR